MTTEKKKIKQNNNELISQVDQISRVKRGEAVNRRTLEKRMSLISRRQAFSQSHLTDHRGNISWFAFHAIQVQQDRED